MRVLLINAVCGIKSTGRICVDIAKEYEKDGHDVKIAYGRERVPENCKKYAVRIGNDIDVYWHALMSKTIGLRGYCSKNATKKFLEWADEYNPDILWLHNLHDYFINIEMLFAWIKKRENMQVRWTHHDCWAFTGYCCYFSFVECEKWKNNQCSKCPKIKESKLNLYDYAERNYIRNRRTFTGVKNMELITPSQWLADLIKESYLGEYKVGVIYNMIDTSVFYPRKSEFRVKKNLLGKKMILGVASPWSKRKGLDDFIKLSEMIDDDYRIVLVGLDEKQIASLPKKIIGIAHTDSVTELAEIYSTADVFVNPTYEDNYPTTNLEAQACGTPVITYRTGGSPESVPAENVCSRGDVKALYKKIITNDYLAAKKIENHSILR